MTIKAIRNWNFTLAANARRHFDVTGDFVTCLEADGDFQIEFDGQSPGIRLEKGISIYFEGVYTSYNVVDLSGASNALEIYSGFNRIDDKRFTPTSSLPSPTTFDSLADVACPNSALTLIMAAATDRREAIITTTGSATIRIGDSSGSASNGVTLGANGTLILATTGAIYARNDTGGAITVSVAVTQN